MVFRAVRGGTSLKSKDMNEAKQKLRERCNDILNAQLGVKHTEHWWNSKNRAFDMQTPNEIWETDRYGLVYSYLLNTLDGQ